MYRNPCIDSMRFFCTHSSGLIHSVRHAVLPPHNSRSWRKPSIVDLQQTNNSPATRGAVATLLRLPNLDRAGVQNAMLVKMPRGPVDENRGSIRGDSDSFEAALRRDLASTPVISYESTIGGWSKRAFDIALTSVTAPAWLLLMLLSVAAAKLRHREPVLYADDRIGYGGNAFRCFHLRLDPSTAHVLVLRPEALTNDLSALAMRAEDRRAKWRRGLERLPQLFNVLRGEMSLVGPAPLTCAEVEPLKTAKRYYLSARPGVVGVSAVVGEHEERAAQYKVYSLCWSLATDASLLLKAFVSLRERGELWKPKLHDLKAPRNENEDAGVERAPRMESASNSRQ